MENKKCNKCNTQKSLNQFSLKRSAKDGHCSICKECEKEKHKLYYQQNRDKILNKMKLDYPSKPKRIITREQRDKLNSKRKEIRKSSPEIALYREAKNRAKRKGLEFSIELKDIIITPVCPILLIPLIVGDGKLTKNSPSLDRVDNSKGYTKNNVMVISHLANTMKSSANKEELLRFADFIHEFFREDTKNE